jgi:ribose-phosphate pyrophosphokinase
MEKLYFSFGGHDALTDTLVKKSQASLAEIIVRRFPDGESYVRILTEVKNKELVLVCNLHQPDDKLMSLYFLAKTARSLGVGKITVIIPYLPYMRQDKVFNPGEGLSSTYFAAFVSGFADELITIDPHLHRRSSLSEIYTIPCIVKHAANHVAEWIKQNVNKAVIIGPDSESEQWVSDVAKKAGAKFTVLQKIRRGDKDIEVSIPNSADLKDHTPVLVDDIISTGRTMIETVKHLLALKMKAPVCIGVHAVFAGNAFDEIINAGAARVITCNTIPHPSNQIDISELVRLAV